MMFETIRALIGVDKDVSKQGIICVSARDMELISHRIQRLISSMKNKRQVSRQNFYFGLEI